MDDKLGTVSGINCKIKGSGNVMLTIPDIAGKSVKIPLKNALYVPDLPPRSNGSFLRLLSVRLATATCLRCSFAIDRDTLENDSGVSIPLIRSRGLIWLPTTEPCTALPALSTISRDLINRRCGHLHEDGLLKLDRLGIDGMWGFSKLPPLHTGAL
jgi:hypothetical protein